MECTIFDKEGRKELHYGAQHYAGIVGLVYQVSEECVNLIRSCKVEEIQKVITHIQEVSPHIGSTNSL